MVDKIKNGSNINPVMLSEIAGSPTFMKYDTVEGSSLEFDTPVTKTVVTIEKELRTKVNDEVGRNVVY